MISLSLLSFSLSPSPPPLSIQHHKEYLGKFCLKFLLARNGFHLPPPERKEFRTQLGFLVRYVGCARVSEVSRKACGVCAGAVGRGGRGGRRAACVMHSRSAAVTLITHGTFPPSAVLAHIHACMHTIYIHHACKIYAYMLTYIHAYIPTPVMADKDMACSCLSSSRRARTCGHGGSSLVALN